MKKAYSTLYTLLLASLILPFVGCADESAIVPAEPEANLFAITDNPSDVVQHERYLLYKEFGVPVYFNDTIGTKSKGVDRFGRPVSVYETVDLPWAYNSYDHNTTYKYDYLTSEAEQLKALSYVRTFLSTVSKAMRPFSIMVADTLTVSSASSTEVPTYHVGVRTTVFAQTTNFADSASMKARIDSIVNSMVFDRVKANTRVCEEFRAQAADKGWYATDWKDLGNCPTILEWNGGRTWQITVNSLFNEAPFTTYNGEDFVTKTLNADPSAKYYLATEEEAIAIRDKMVAEMAAYGFLRGWKEFYQQSPQDDNEDREYYLRTMLELGDERFRERYATYPRVMEKYTILYKFVTETLGVDLSYNH